MKTQVLLHTVLGKWIVVMYRLTHHPPIANYMPPRLCSNVQAHHISTTRRINTSWFSKKQKANSKGSKASKGVEVIQEVKGFGTRK